MRYLHVKTQKKYKVLFHVAMEQTLETGVVYQSLSDGTIWVRSAKEFYDGRFELYIEQKGVENE